MNGNGSFGSIKLTGRSMLPSGGGQFGPQFKYGNRTKLVFSENSDKMTFSTRVPAILSELVTESVVNSSFPSMYLDSDYLTDEGGGVNGSFYSTPAIDDDFNVTLISNDSFISNGTGEIYTSPATVFAALVILSVSIIFGNSLVIIAVIREHYLKSPPHYFVASLAAADFCVGTLLLPFEAITQLFDRRWMFGDLWCELWHSFDVLLSTASILNLCIISLDRYWAICTPMSYSRRMTSARAFKFIALVWILSILISFPAIFWWRSVRTEDIPEFACPFTEDIGYLVSSSCISFYIPLSVMLYAYFKIYRAAVKQSKSIRQGVKSFSSLDRNGESEDLTIRVHRGGCCENEANGNANGRRLGQHRKSFSCTRPDQSGISLLASSCRRAASFRVYNKKSPFLEPTCPQNEIAKIHGARGDDDNESRQNGDLNGSDELCVPNGGILQAKPELRVSLNNNYNHRYQQNRRSHFAPEFGLAASSTSIASPFRRHSRRSFTVARKLAKFAKEKKAAKTLAIVLGVFIICWLPFFVINIVFAICKSCAKKHEKLFDVVTYMGWVNSALNPVIYACWSPDLRRAFARLLGCGRCMRARRRKKSLRRFSEV